MSFAFRDSGLVTSTLQGAIAEEKEDVDPIGDADPKIAAVASVEVAAAIDVSGAALSSPSSNRGNGAHLLLAVLERILALFLAWEILTRATLQGLWWRLGALHQLIPLGLLEQV